MDRTARPSRGQRPNRRHRTQAEIDIYDDFIRRSIERWTHLATWERPIDENHNELAQPNLQQPVPPQEPPPPPLHEPLFANDDEYEAEFRQELLDMIGVAHNISISYGEMENHTNNVYRTAAAVVRAGTAAEPHSLSDELRRLSRLTGQAISSRNDPPPRAVQQRPRTPPGAVTFEHIYQASMRRQYGESAPAQFRSMSYNLAQYGLQPSELYGPSTSRLHGSSSLAQHGPSASAQYRPLSSAQHGPSTSAQYRPSTSAQHGPSTSTQHGLSTSAQHGPSTSAQYGPSSSAHYGPSTSTQQRSSSLAQYGPSSPTQFGPSTSTQHGPSTSGQHGPSTSNQSSKSNKKKDAKKETSEDKSQKKSKSKIKSFFHF